AILFAVVIYARNDKYRNGEGSLRSAPSSPRGLTIILPVIFMLIATLGNSYFVMFQVPAVFFLGAAGYWFIANKNSAGSGLRLKKVLVLAVSIMLVTTPVLIDRMILRPSARSYSTITRTVVGPLATSVVQAVEGFNASSPQNWSVSQGETEGWYPTFFSGSDLEYFGNRVNHSRNIDMIPIMYTVFQYRRLSYSLNGSLISGNISFTYTNQSLLLDVNGTHIVTCNTTGTWGFTIPFFLFVNASTCPEPAAAPKTVALPDGYMVTMTVDYDEFCGSLCGYWNSWEQWYLVGLDGGIVWAASKDQMHAIS
nr:hypothetical protein [Candidatus Sigynarchaeota archaeon]